MTMFFKCSFLFVTVRFFRWLGLVRLHHTKSHFFTLFYTGCIILRFVSKLYYSILYCSDFVSKPSYSHGFCLGIILFYRFVILNIITNSKPMATPSINESISLILITLSTLWSEGIFIIECLPLPTFYLSLESLF